MKKLKNMLSMAAAATLTCAIMSSCATSSADDQPEVYMNFATLVTSTSTGCVWSVQEKDNTEPVLLSSTVALTGGGYSVGDRYVIAYSTSDDQPFTAGPISLYNAVYAYTGEATFATQEEIEKYTDYVNSRYVDRVGKWLNLQLEGAVSKWPEAVGLIVDSATADEEYPDVYLVMRSDNSANIQVNGFYASFDLEPIYELPNAKGFTLHVDYFGVPQARKFDKP